jgi:hypothetical protein
MRGIPAHHAISSHSKTATSVPIPKFAIERAALLCELRVRGTSRGLRFKPAVDPQYVVCMLRWGLYR